MKLHCLYDALVPVHELKVHPKNRNKHPDAQIKRLAEILSYQGFRYPIKVSKRSGFITSGHGRLLAARKNGWESVPVNYQDYDSLEQEYADVQADNAIASWAELDLSGINLDIPDLGPDFNLDFLGIEDFTLDLIEKLAPGDPDEVGEPPEEPETKIGDLYELGKHRLLCGDATIQTNYDLLLKGEKPILMVTDPPYGVKLDQSWRDEAIGNGFKGNANLVLNDDRADWYDVWAISNVDVCYVWHASVFSDVVMDSLRRAGFEVRQQIIWNKSVMVFGRSAYHWKHEPCWYAVKKGSTANWLGDRKQTTVWEAVGPNQVAGNSKEEKTSHPTQKPILLYEIPIENHTKRGDLLYEPFSGSGSAFIACEKQSRRVYGMELDPKYCDVIVNRYVKYTGNNKITRNGEPITWEG